MTYFSGHVHFKNKSETDNPCAFRETYLPFMHSRSSKQANDITLIENDEVITDKNELAELFNNYFVTSLMMYRTLKNITLETNSAHTPAFEQLWRKTGERMPYIILTLHTPIRPKLKNCYLTSTNARPVATAP